MAADSRSFTINHFGQNDGEPTPAKRADNSFTPTDVSDVLRRQQDGTIPQRHGIIVRTGQAQRKQKRAAKWHAPSDVAVDLAMLRLEDERACGFARGHSEMMRRQRPFM